MLTAGRPADGVVVVVEMNSPNFDVTRRKAGAGVEMHLRPGLSSLPGRDRGKEQRSLDPGRAQAAVRGAPSRVVGRS